MGKIATSLLLFLLLSSFSLPHQAVQATSPVHVGVILDLETPVGMACMTSITMAVEDFYAEHHNYTTRIVLHPRDSGEGVVGAASAALDLLRRVKVKAILGLQRSAQAEFVIELGNKSHVPIVSFSATSPSISPTYFPYFIRVALNSSAQASAVASLARAFGWREVIPIYEDTEYSNGVIPYFIDAFQEVDARVPYRSVLSSAATDDEITRNLKKLKRMQTQVFLVHLLPPLSSRLFLKAEEEGMTGAGYVWIITQGLADRLENLEPEVIRSMSGAVGVKSYVQGSGKLDNFTARWSARFRNQYPNAITAYPGVLGLRAYDATQALAMAAEKAGMTNLDFSNPNISDDSTDLMTLGVSHTGERLRKEILDSDYPGMSGKLHFVDGQLQSSTFQIVNVVDNGWSSLGFWTASHGLSQQLESTKSNRAYSASFSNLGAITWPGGSDKAPKGWHIPGGKLRVGVPVPKGFYEFVKVDWNPLNVTGYSIEVFQNVIEHLPYKVPYELIPYNFSGRDASYNELIDQIVSNNFDAVVGDVSITANRSLYVDFALPYTETGVSMLVPIRKGEDDNGWIFLRPLTKGLWLTTLGFFIYTGFVVWVIEHRVNQEFRGQPSQQIGVIFYFAFSTLVFSHKEKIRSNLSRVVVIMWVFVLLILTSSYTASLSSMLTAEQLKPTVTNIHDLLKNGDSIGYQERSFVKGLLEDMGFDASKLKPYSGVDKYVEALSLGSSNGGVTVILDEIPYIKLVLKEHCTEYMMVGPIFKTAGFGFVFPKNSPLTPDISRAILNVTQEPILLDMEMKYFGDLSTCPTETAKVAKNRLKLQSFWVPFLMTGAVSVISLLIFLSNFCYKHRSGLLGEMASENTLRGKIIVCMKYYDNKDCSSPEFENNEHVREGGSAESRRGAEDVRTAVPDFSGSQCPIDTTDESIWSFADRLQRSLSVEEPHYFQDSPTDSLSVEIV